jgi:fructosamine-3-kinase
VDAGARESLERLLGAGVARASAVRGGDVDDAWRVEMVDGRRVFVKTDARADAGRFAAEARGLAWLAEGPLRVPRVLAAEPGFLALEWIERAPATRGADEALGRGLARLHRLGAPSFGLAHASFLATIPLENEPARDWPAFYGERRLMPLLGRAIARGASSRRMERGVERVVADLPSLVGPAEPPARLHGDLWGGNVMHDEHGAPVLIDPGVYGGHREIDLAMMQLFGGVSPAVLEAYDDEHPRAAGHEARVPLYQLLPLLAHAVLFGASWISAIESALDRIGRP